jgi:hypothetical protein
MVLVLLLVAGVLVLLQGCYLLMRRRLRTRQLAKLSPDPEPSLDPPAPYYEPQLVDKPSEMHGQRVTLQPISSKVGELAKQGEQTTTPKTIFPPGKVVPLPAPDMDDLEEYEL